MRSYIFLFTYYIQRSHHNYRHYLPVISHCRVIAKVKVVRVVRGGSCGAGRSARRWWLCSRWTARLARQARSQGARARARRAQGARAARGRRGARARKVPASSTSACPPRRTCTRRPPPRTTRCSPRDSIAVLVVQSPYKTNRPTHFLLSEQSQFLFFHSFYVLFVSFVCSRSPLPLVALERPLEIWNSIEILHLRPLIGHLLLSHS